MIIFGGCTFDMKPLGDVWLYRYATNTWRELIPHGYGPAPRWLAASAAIRSPPMPLLNAKGAPVPPPNGSYYEALEKSDHPELVGTAAADTAAAQAAAAEEMAEAVAETQDAIAAAVAQADAAADGGAAPGGTGKFRQMLAGFPSVSTKSLPSSTKSLPTSASGLKGAATGKLSGGAKPSPGGAAGAAAAGKFDPAGNDNVIPDPQNPFLPAPTPLPPSALLKSQVDAINAVYGRVVDAEAPALEAGTWSDGESPEFVKMRRAMGLDGDSYSAVNTQQLAAAAEAEKKRRLLEAGKPKEDANATDNGAAIVTGAPAPVFLEVGSHESDEQRMLLAAAAASEHRFAATKAAAHAAIGAATRAGQGVDASLVHASRSRRERNPAAAVSAGEAAEARRRPPRPTEADLFDLRPPSYHDTPDAGYGMDKEGQGTALYVHGGATGNGVVFGDHFILHMFPQAAADASSSSGLPALPPVVGIWEELVDLNAGPIGREGAAAIVVTSNPAESGIGGYEEAAKAYLEKAAAAAAGGADGAAAAGSTPATGAATKPTTATAANGKPPAGTKPRFLSPEQEWDSAGVDQEPGAELASMAAADKRRGAKGFKGTVAPSMQIAADGSTSSYTFAPNPAPYSQWILLFGGAQRSVPVMVDPRPRDLDPPFGSLLIEAREALLKEEGLATTGSDLTADDGE